MNSTVKAVPFQQRKAKTFEAYARVLPSPDDELEIREAVLTDERREKEMKLLDKESKTLPKSKRTQALARKYQGLGHDQEVVNGYPSSVVEGNYIIHVTAPDDPSLPLSTRPDPYYAQIILENSGNKWFFRFPMTRVSSVDGQSVYKLDGFDTFLDENLTQINAPGMESAEGTPYDILQNFYRGKYSPAEKFIEKGGVYNFTFPGFLVGYSRDTEKLAKQVARKKHYGNPDVLPQRFSYDHTEVPVGSEDFVRYASENGVAVQGVESLSVEDVIVNSYHLGTATSRYVWLYYRGVGFDESGNQVIGAALLSTVGEAGKFLGMKKPTEPKISDAVRKNNNAVLKTFRGE